MHKIFLESQDELLKLSNSEYGKEILSIDPYDEFHKVLLILPHAVFFKDGSYITGRFYTHNYFYKRLVLMSRCLKDAGFSKDLDVTLKFPEYPSVKLIDSYDTYGPVSGGYGRVYKNDGGSFAANRSASAGSATDSLGYIATRPGGSSWEIARFFNPHDTSAIGSSATVVSWFLRLIASGGTFQNADSTSVEIVDSTQASTSSLGTDDYDQAGSTSFGTLNFSSWTNTASANNDITGSDLTKISKTGVTKLALRTGRDYGNSSPSGENILNWTSSTMVLSVTFSVPLSGAAWFM